MATHSCILAWRIPWTEEPGKLSYDKSRQRIIKQRHYFVNKGPYSQSYGFSSSHVWMYGVIYGGGNGNPLQYSYLENPMDREAWLTTVYGVARVKHDLATKPPPCVNVRVGP